MKNDKERHMNKNRLSPSSPIGVIAEVEAYDTVLPGCLGQGARMCTAFLDLSKIMLFSLNTIH